MRAPHYAWLTAAGLATVIAPGTPLWLLPLAGFAGQVAYEIDPEEWQRWGTQQRQRLSDGMSHLPELRRMLPGQRLQAAPDEPQSPPAVADAPPDAPPGASPARDPLFAALDERPHRLVIGHSGGGKTTLLHELATSWAAQGDRVIVCDPDAAPGQWPGCRVRGGGDDYAAIAQVLVGAAAETARRRKQRHEDGQLKFPPIHLVIDEVQDVIAEVEGAWDVLEPMIRRGRKLDMHLTLGVQDNAVSTLDLEGKSALLNNLVTVDLLVEQGNRVARFGKGKAARVLPVPTLRDPETLVVPRSRPAAAPVVVAVAAPEPEQAMAPTPAATGTTEPLTTPAPASDSLLEQLLAAVPAGQTALTVDTAPDQASQASERQSQDGQALTQTVTHPVSGHGLGQTIRAVTASGDGQAIVHNHVLVLTGRAGFGRGMRRVRRRRNAAPPAPDAQSEESLEVVYARLHQQGVPSFTKAYAIAGGNSERARAAWKAAKDAVTTQ